MTQFDFVFSKKLIFITGKGGVGKTLVSALLAQKAARSGKRVLLMESSGAKERLAPMFGHRQVGHNETQIAPNLSIININPEKCFEEYVAIHLGMTAIYEKIFEQKIVKSFLNAIPGLAEVMLLGRMLYSVKLSKKNPYDLFIFDSPAFGHFLSLIKTPSGILHSSLAGPLVAEVRKIHSLLTDQSLSAFFPVTCSQELINTETLEFIKKIQDESLLAFGGVILNKSYGDEVLSSGLSADLTSLKDEHKTYLKFHWAQMVTEKAKLISALTQTGMSTNLLELKDLGAVSTPLDGVLSERIWI